MLTRGALRDGEEEERGRRFFFFRENSKINKLKRRDSRKLEVRLRVASKKKKLDLRLVVFLCHLSFRCSNHRRLSL